MKVSHKAWLLSLLLLITPLFVAYGKEAGKENPQIAKTATKVTLPANTKTAKQVALINKERAALRKSITAQKKQVSKFVKSQYKQGQSKKNKKQVAKKKPSTQQLPTRLGIRTWSYPETANGRINKINELRVRITEKENAYDAETGRLQSLGKEYTRLKGELQRAQKTLEYAMEPQLKALENYRQAQTQAANNPQISVEPQRMNYLKTVEQTSAAINAANKSIVAYQAKLAPIETQLNASQTRMNDIMTHLDALHQHRTDVSDVVFLRTVGD